MPELKQYPVIRPTTYPGAAVTIDGKQYIVEQPTSWCTDCAWYGKDCDHHATGEYLLNCIPTLNEQLTLTRHWDFSFRRAKETHRGRRAIASDYLVGRILWAVLHSSLELFSWRVQPLHTDMIQSMLDEAGTADFTTHRAAFAYRAKLLKERCHENN